MKNMTNQGVPQAGLEVEATIKRPLNTSTLEENIRRRLSEVARRVGEDGLSAQNDEDGFHLSFEAACAEANGYLQGVLDAGGVNEGEFRKYKEELLSMLNGHVAFSLSKAKQLV